MEDEQGAFLTPTRTEDSLSSDLSGLRHKTRSAPSVKKRGVITVTPHCANNSKRTRKVFLNSRSLTTLTTNRSAEDGNSFSSSFQDSNRNSNCLQEEPCEVHSVSDKLGGASVEALVSCDFNDREREVNVAPGLERGDPQQITFTQMGILLPLESTFMEERVSSDVFHFDDSHCEIDTDHEFSADMYIKPNASSGRERLKGDTQVSGDFVDMNEDSNGFDFTCDATLDVAVSSEDGLSGPSDPSSGHFDTNGQGHPHLPFSSYAPRYGRQLSKRKSDAVETCVPCGSDHGAPKDVSNVNDVEQEEDEEDDDDFHSCGRRSSSCTPTLPKSRRLEDFDPYQIFEVQHSPCLILTVKVIRGRNITYGFRDFLDTPDPYINLVMKNSPDGKKCTSVKENCTNPEWNETFTFFLNFSQSNELEISLMESNYLMDESVGTVYFDVVKIREMDKIFLETFIFNNVSEVDIELKLEFDQNPTLRYSLCLSEAEKNFVTQRKEKVLNGIKKLLGENEGPHSLNEVPTIAVIGSGGGFRAMTGYSGVFKALRESGVLDCTTYVCGLSGSSWFLSTLYSHPKWPNMDMDEFLDELKNSVDKSLLRFFNASTIYKYTKYMVQKRKEGQPVSFTDIFGMMVGETLLKGRMESTLTDQREKIKGGNNPMPLYTCVHVKKDVPAKSFQEWVEFSPYEIGMPKYGTFMDSELFGSKFFMGKLVKKYKEQPLHFLQGIWGSAFCVLFRRLLEDNRRIDPAEMMRLEIGKQMKRDERHLDQTDLIRQEMGKELAEEGEESSSDPSEDDGNEEDEDEDEDSLFSNNTSLDSGDIQNTDEKMDTRSADRLFSSVKPSFEKISSLSTGSKSMTLIGSKGVTLKDADQDSAYDGESEEDTNMSDTVKELTVHFKEPQLEFEKFQGTTSLQSSLRKSSFNPKSPRQDLNDGSKKTVNWGECPTRENKNVGVKRQAYIRAGSSFRKSKGASRSYWKNLLHGIFESNSWEFITTRRGRAAVIHNFMRGLNLQQTYPLSPFTPLEKRVREGDVFDGIFEMHPTSVKHIYMVDAGLTFNSPYPLVLRPQRQIDIILSFDFSARASDNTPPFKELKLAEQWAKLNRLPFPPIDTSVFEREGMKELYIFRHPTDPHCPIVLHFVLINKTFKNFKAPGVPRESKEEFDFANFDVFDDPKAPFSTFNFTYTHNNFERLSQLMEFNTLLHIEEIKQAIREVLKKMREGPPRVPIHSKDINYLRLRSVKEMRKLKKFISRMEGSHSSSTPSPQSTTQPSSTPISNPFFTGFVKTMHASNGSVAQSSVESFSVDISTNDNLKSNSQTLSIDKADSKLNMRGRPILQSTSSSESIFGTPPQTLDYLHSHAAKDQPRDVNEDSGMSSSINHEVLSDHETLESCIPSSPLFTSKPALSPTKTHLSRLCFNATDSGISTSSLQTPPSENSSSSSKTHRESPPNPFFVNAHLMRSSLSNLSSSSSSSSFEKFNGKSNSQCSTNTSCDRTTQHKKISPLARCLEAHVSVEEYTMAPEAFKSDGTPVIDSVEAKMYYESAKAKRKLLRRQSTITSLSSISLDEFTHDETSLQDEPNHIVANGAIMDPENNSKFDMPANDLLSHSVKTNETHNLDDIKDLSVFSGTMSFQ